MSTSYGYIAGSCGHRVDPFNMEFCVWGLLMEVEPGSEAQNHLGLYSKHVAYSCDVQLP